MKPIQQKVLPLALAGNDVVGIAPTGSGKTLAFLVPALVHAVGQPAVLRPADGPIALVLAPTRELAVQIGAVAEGLLKPSRERHHRSGQREREGYNCTVLYGGPRRSDQLSTMRFQRGTHLVIATPGRLLDFLRTDAFKLRRVSFFVLDEGDRMLDFGFEPDVTAISAQIRQDRQMLFFSATWPKEVEMAAGRLCAKGQTFMRVSLEQEQADGPSAAGGGGGGGGGRTLLDLPGHDGITLPPREIQQVVEVIGSGPSWNRGNLMEKKISMLLRYLEEALGGEIGETPGKALIFVGTRSSAEELGMTVARYFGLDRCGVMHGARKQDQRESTLQAFRDGRLRALVSTDVLGRGVDIANVSHVVIFDFPSDIETYVHRVGRTGRNGALGKAITFFEPQPWYPNLAHELAEVLRNCGQEVPDSLVQEERRNNLGFSSGAGDDDVGQPLWLENSSPTQAPPLEDRGSPALAEAAELGPWDVGGARVWGYSANGGVSEQGRVELRAGGILRTTWGWGEWALRTPSEQPQPPASMQPHCPPPSRPCPVPAGCEEEQQPAACEAGAEEENGQPNCLQLARPGPQPSQDELAASIAEAPANASVVAAAAQVHLALMWGGVTDVVALDGTGLGFELVTRNGRPAFTYKKKTFGRALPGVEL